MTLRPFSVSRLPVGSSASTTSGVLNNARAIATRCCSPPDISAGTRLASAATPNWSSSAIARSYCARPDSPANSPGSITFSTADNPASKLNDWNTYPIVLLRMPASSRRDSLLTLFWLSRTSPLVGGSSSPRMLNNVDFPEPDGPTSATNSPGNICRSMPLRMGVAAAARPNDLQSSRASRTAVTEALATALFHGVILGPDRCGSGGAPETMPTSVGATTMRSRRWRAIRRPHSPVLHRRPLPGHRGQHPDVHGQESLDVGIHQPVGTGNRRIGRPSARLRLTWHPLTPSQHLPSECLRLPSVG